MNSGFQTQFTKLFCFNLAKLIYFRNEDWKQASFLQIWSVLEQTYNVSMTEECPELGRAMQKLNLKRRYRLFKVILIVLASRLPLALMAKSNRMTNIDEAG